MIYAVVYYTCILIDVIYLFSRLEFMVSQTVNWNGLFWKLSVVKLAKSRLEKKVQSILYCTEIYELWTAENE